jgi:hypothetical protein
MVGLPTGKAESGRDPGRLAITLITTHAKNTKENLATFASLREPFLKVVMMSNLLRLVLAIVIGAHGIGHILFLVPLLGIADWGQSTQSWLLGAGSPARLIGSLLWLVATAGFIAVAVGLFGDTAWWRPLAFISAIVSLVGLILFWATPTASSAFFALVFNVIVIASLWLLNWPPVAVAGR